MSDVWTVWHRPSPGRLWFKLAETASQLMLADILKRIDLERAGVRPDALAAHANGPLADHLADWRASMAASGRPNDYLDRKLNRVTRAFATCGFGRLADLDAAALERHLHAARQAGKSVQTSNDDLQACRQFAQWMVANERMARDPFARLKKGNAELDRRHIRDVLSHAERAALLATALASPSGNPRNARVRYDLQAIWSGEGGIRTHGGSYPTRL